MTGTSTCRESVVTRQSVLACNPVLTSLKVIPTEEAKRGLCLIATDLTEQKKTQNRLSEHAALLDLAHDAIVFHGLDGQILFWNSGAKDVYGWSPEEAVGKVSHHLLRTVFPQPLESIQDLVQRDQLWEGELKHTSRDGKVVVVASRWSLMRDVDGNPSKILEINRDITEKSRAEETLRESEARYRALVTASSQIVWITDAEGRVTQDLPTWRQFTGRSEQETQGSGWMKALHPEDRQKTAEIWSRALLQCAPFETEYRVRRHDGKYRIMTARGLSVCDKHGNVREWIGTCTDMTERERVKADLRIERERLALALTIGKSGTFDWYIQNNINLWSPELEELYGLSPDKFGGTYEDWERFVVAEDLGHAKAAIQNSLKTGEFASEWRIRRRRDGQIRWMDARAKVFFEDVGQPSRMVGINVDITERKRAEEALRESEERFPAMANGIPQLAWMAEADGFIFWYNQRWYEYTGRTYEQMQGWKWQSVHDPAALPSVLEAWKVSIANGTPFDMEFPLRGADGIFRMFLTRVMPVKDSSGRVVRWFGTNTDVSEINRARDEIRKLNLELEERVQQRTAQLRESEQRVRRKLESILTPESDLESLELADLLDTPAVQALADGVHRLAQIPMFILDLEGRVLVSVGWQEICTKFHRANPEACKNCQESDRELSRGVAPGEFKLYKCKNNLWDVVTPIMLGEKQIGHLFSGQFFFKDETVDHELFRSQARRYGFDEQKYLTALDRVPRLSRAEVETGMTFYVRLAQLLSQLSYTGIRLARSMGEINHANTALAASVKELESFNYAVAHDLRAPLRHIHGFAEILAEEASPVLNESAKRHLETIQDSVHHMEHLLEDLLSLSRLGRQELSKRPCGFNSLVREVVTSPKPEIINRQVEWQIAELPIVECDPALMKQVLFNLLSNALKFTRSRQPAVIEIGETILGGEHVVFIRDNGVGFSMKYVDKLFGLFQRLHRQQDFEGTGVGLAIVQRIVHRHGGRVWAEAEPDKRATFYLSLQRCEVEKKELATDAVAV